MFASTFVLLALASSPITPESDLSPVAFGHPLESVVATEMELNSLEAELEALQIADRYRIELRDFRINALRLAESAEAIRAGAPAEAYRTQREFAARRIASVNRTLTAETDRLAIEADAETAYRLDRLQVRMQRLTDGSNRDQINLAGRL